MKWFFIIPFVVCFISILFLTFSIEHKIREKYEIKKKDESIVEQYFVVLKLLIYSFVPILNLCFIYLILFTDFEDKVEEKIIEVMIKEGRIESIDKSEKV